MFKRKRKAAQEDPELDALGVDDGADDGVDEGVLAGADADATGEASAPPASPPSRPQGPWDVADAPEREGDRLDLGALRLPVSQGLDIRVDLSPQGEVVAATMVRGESALQVSAFAAPRTEGIWDEVRAEINESLGRGGGQAEEVPGPFGTELRAGVPTQVPGQGVVLAAARFVGVDGPRWFLRGLITGAAASDADRAAELEADFREIVVVRGGDPMVVRDPLLLTLPPDVAAQATQAAAQAQASAQTPPTTPAVPLTPQERGPEIAEIR